MKSKLFTYAVLFHPTDKEAKEGQKSKIVVEPTHALAADDKALGLRVAMEIPQEYKDRLDQIEIVIRPF